MIIEHPVFMILATLSIFRIGEVLFDKSGKIPIFNPVIISIAFLVCFLIIFNVTYTEYKQATNALYLMLAPAIISLAVPLHKNIERVKEFLPAIALTVIIAGSGIVLSAVALALWAHLPEPMVLALMTKSISAPIALEVANLLDGDPSLTIIAVFSTGLPGVIIVPTLLRTLNINDDATKGLILGITAHAFGIARATSISPSATAFATIGMGLMGCFVAFITPLFISLIKHL